jgi:hypothetical protein
MDKPKKLILDYSKWRSGGYWKNQTGIGKEKLLNDCGFMCFLGQYHMQLGATEKQLLCSGPVNLSLDPPSFSEEAIMINDDPDTTPERKIELLKELIVKEGIELEVINKPDIINS